MKTLFLLLRFIINFVVHLAILFKMIDFGIFGGRWALFAKPCQAQPKNDSDDEMNPKSSVIFKIVCISFQILVLSTPCYASSINWSPLDWAKKIVFGKQHEATQAYKKQDYEQSLATFHDLMNKDPYNPEYNYNVGDILYRQKKYSDAKQAFARAVEYARKSSKLAEQAHFNIGNSCYQLEQWHDAVNAYQQVLKINEENESARHNLELALYKLKEQEMKDKQQEKKEKQENKKDKSQQDKNKDRSCDKQEQSQDDQSGGDDSDQGNEGNSQQDQGDQKPGSQKNNNDSGGGQQKDKNDGGNERDEKSQEKSAAKGEQESADGNDDTLDEQGMHESDKEGSEKSSKNKLQDSGTEKKETDDAMNQFEKTQGMGQDEQSAAEQTTDIGDDADKAKGISQAHKKPELKNQLQDQYESKASQDERLTDYHASVMKTLEDLEEKIQKHIIKNKVAAQGAGQNGKNGW